jgi:hypothetical protein
LIIHPLEFIYKYLREVYAYVNAAN